MNAESIILLEILEINFLKKQLQTLVIYLHCKA